MAWLRAWFDRKGLKQLSKADWVEALKPALVGNIVYYLFLASAIQRAGGPLPTMIIGTLPVVIAITSKLRVAASKRVVDGKGRCSTRAISAMTATSQPIIAPG